MVKKINIWFEIKINWVKRLPIDHRQNKCNHTHNKEKRHNENIVDINQISDPQDPILAYVATAAALYFS